MPQEFEVTSKLSKKHLVATLLIATLIVVNLIGVLLFSTTQSKDAQIINVAGQQRMLSQKIALYHEKLNLEQDENMAVAIRQQLKSANLTFKQNHQFLISPKSNWFFYAGLSHPLEQLYFSQPSLHKLSERFLRWASTNESKVKNESDIIFKEQELETLLMLLNEAVYLFEIEANKKHNMLITLFFVSTIFILFALWFTFIRLFKPLERRIKVTLEELTYQKDTASLLMKEANTANDAKTKFLSSMSHELRTPLNGIFGMLDLALEQEQNTAKDSLIRKAKRSGSHLLRIINDILDITAIEKKRSQIESFNFSAVQVLEECLAPIAIICDKKDITLDIEINPDIPTYLYGPGNKLGQVINNILSNAVKFTERGTIGFKAYTNINGDNVNLTVEISDTGIGMTQKQQEQIFTAFHQADNSISRKYGGTGLGLTIAREIVDRIGGVLEIDSTFEVGSSFCLKIPFKLATLPSEREIELAKLAARYDLSRKKVAVVDDLEISRTFIAHQLSIINVRGEFFSNGPDLLASDINQYDVFVIDLNMPDMNGDQVAKRLQDKLPNDSDKKFILISADEDMFDDILVKSHCFDYHFKKPINETQFFDALVSLLLPSGESHQPKNYHVLIAEDNEINAQIAKQYLEVNGYNVHQAKDGQEAVELCRKQQIQIDLILMDINMPKMDGYEATNIIRNELGLNIPIIALTANAFDEDIKKSLELGMVAHLIKPINKETLIQALRESLVEIN